MPTFNIEAGKTCKIDAGDTGMTFEGPAIVICIKGNDLEKINLPIQVDEQSVSKNTLDLLNKVIGVAHKIVDAGNINEIDLSVRSCVEVAEMLTDVIETLKYQGL